ncbi:NlpC/P60 family protein [Streptomyces sp. NPDC046881]|uniref:NlpC/P60 family protein n=1 Tax=Streptomyces sp. NPDC046881 TaxID=3155374 RepID=UPI0033DE3C26
MASHRKPRPGGTPGAGIGTPALATAALTSVAVLSQTAEAAPLPAVGHAAPSPEEVERKIDDLYRRAESAAEAAAAGKERGGRTDRGNGRGERGAERRAGGPEQGSGRAEGRGERAEGAEAPGRRADSLQRLRNEVARRAQHRALPNLRGMIPAQRGGQVQRGGQIQRDAGRAGGTGVAPAAAPAMGSTGFSPSVAGGTGVAPTMGSTGFSPSAAGGTAAAPAPGATGFSPSVGGSGIAPSAGETAVTGASPDTGTARHARGTRVAPPVREAGIAQLAGDTGVGLPVQDTGIASPVRETGITPPARDTAIAAARDTGLASPLQDTSVRDTAVAPPARDTAVGAAAVQDSGAGAAARESAATALTAATPATAPTAAASAAAPVTGRPDAVASGPQAAKAAVQKKLAHARVLLVQHAVQAATAPSGTYATKARKAIAFARAQVGKPCVWGAAGPGSYDCSGLTQAAWKSAGVTLPRTAREQAEAGTPVPPADARPGDLVFFHDDVSHVGLCTGDGMMIHAPRPGAYVREEPVSGIGESAVHSVVRPG